MLGSSGSVLGGVGGPPPGPKVGAGILATALYLSGHRDLYNREETRTNLCLCLSYPTSTTGNVHLRGIAFPPGSCKEQDNRLEMRQQGQIDVTPSTRKTTG